MGNIILYSMYIVVQRNCPKEFLQHCVSHLNGHLSIDTLWHDQIFMTSLKCTLFMLQFCVPQNSSDLTTIFPPIVSAETSLLWKWKMWKFSYSFCVTVIFYFINWIVAAETIEGGKLFKGGNYSRKYGNLKWPSVGLLTVFHLSSNSLNILINVVDLSKIPYLVSFDKAISRYRKAKIMI